MRIFIDRMGTEDVDLNQLGIRGKTKNTILEQLKAVYG